MTNTHCYQWDNVYISYKDCGINQKEGQVQQHKLSDPLAQGYVCQRILYLMTYQVMKLYSLLLIKEGEGIDQFRNRVNRRNISYSQFILMIRKQIIIPILRKSEMVDPDPYRLVIDEYVQVEQCTTM